MAESEELKSLLMNVKEESEKFGLMLNIQKTKIMASGSITSWQIEGETVETMADFIFLGSKITAFGVCSHEIKIRFLLRRKTMTNLDSILKSRDITLPDFPGGSDCKASTNHVGDPGSIPGLGRSPGEGNDNTLRYPCLEIPMDGGAWWATVHGVAKSNYMISAD